MHQIPGPYFRTPQSGGSPRCVRHIEIYNHDADSNTYNDNEQMRLADVEVSQSGGPINLAGATVKQGDKTDQLSEAVNGQATNAIDGIVATESLTDISNIQRGGVWWKLDLGGEYDVQQIKITAPSTNGAHLEGAFVYARDSNYQILWSTRITGASDGSIHDLTVETCCTPP